MKTIVEVNKRISDLQSELVPQSVEGTFIQRGRIDVWYWLRNGENLRTEKEVQDKIDRIKEELLAIPNDLSMQALEKKARIRELQEFLR